MNILLVLVTTLIAHAEYPVDIPPDATSTMYQQYEKSMDKDDEAQITVSATIQKAISAGNNNLNWLKYMNEVRPADDQIKLTRPGELSSFPIESPSVYNEKIIGDKYNDIIAAIPANMRAIIFENAPMTREPGLAMADYILWAKKVDRMYQSANRWTLMQPNLFYYKQAAYRDLRGYYMLGKEQNLNDNLTRFSQLPLDQQKLYKGYLLGMCANARTMNCSRALDQAVAANTVNGFYQKYLPTSQKLWNSFFDIEPFRHDITWTASNPNLAVVPVRNTTPVIQDFLQYNIEDEWKWNDWHLRLNFTPEAAIHVEFQRNTTPHVSGGNTITMDENTPLTEWDVMWTIRHEFGHTLGFPDCYIEFYDSNLQAMVNYQLDTKNMMCSRAGTMLETHYDHMKSAYFHP